MNPKGSVTERLLQLEGDLQAVKQELRAANHRAARIGAPNNFRIARITNTPSTNDNTFEVIFLDGKYTQSAGQNSPSYESRQLASRAVVYNIAGTKLAQNDIIPVYSWSNRFWTYVTDGTPPTPGGGSADAQIFSGARYWEIDPGGGAASERTGSDAGMFIQGASYGTNGGLAFQSLSFTNQYGTDLGIDFTTDTQHGEHFTFTEDGIYDITIQAQECQAFRAPGASSPSPGTGIYFRFYLSDTQSGGCWDGLDGGDSALELASYCVMSDEPTAGTISHPDGTATKYYQHALNGTVTVYIEPTSGTRKCSLLGQVILDSGTYDGWGVSMTDIYVVIRRLDTSLTAINV